MSTTVHADTLANDRQFFGNAFLFTTQGVAENQEEWEVEKLKPQKKN